MPNPIPLGPLVPPVPGLDQMLIDHPPDISSSSSPPSHDLPPRPSLKRSSSSPTFSPSHSSNPNPFVQNQDHWLPSNLHKSRHRQGFWYSLLGFHPLLSSGTSTPIKVHLLDQSLHLHNPSFFRRWSTNFHRWIFEVSPKCASGSQGVWRSGLAVSLQKTSFYASGLSEQEINTIQASTGMVNGTLSFKYLGVPLNSKKLSLANCEPLLHQVKNHLSSWAVKTLSFAGRLLLIKTIIAGITTFWCWAFILPKAF